MKLLPICKSLWRFDVCFVAYSRDFWGTISSVAAFSFISYVFISIFAILNVVTGVFCTLSRFGSFLFGSFRKGCSTEPSSCQLWFVRFFGGWNHWKPPSQKTLSCLRSPSYWKRPSRQGRDEGKMFVVCSSWNVFSAPRCDGKEHLCIVPVQQSSTAQSRGGSLKNRKPTGKI